MTGRAVYAAGARPRAAGGTFPYPARTVAEVYGPCRACGQPRVTACTYAGCPKHEECPPFYSRVSDR